MRRHPKGQPKEDMCGIVGYTGKINAISQVISGLYALEYRGSDSAGMAYFEENEN